MVKTSGSNCGPTGIVHGDCISELKKIDDEVFDLVIADPPYFRIVIEKWDRQWRTEAEYIEWCKKWLKEVYRTMRYGGTFYLFGYFRNLAPLVPPLLEMGFEVRQQIVIDKGIKAVAGRATKKYKIFPNVTESVLFLTKKNILFTRGFLKDRQKKAGLTAKQINEKLGVKSNGGGMWSIYTGNNICEQFPTEELWNKLQKILDFDLPYNKIAQTFYPEMGITDVWTDIDFYEEKRYHPTQKPLKLIKRLIEASSNKGDYILDPFAGSGSTYVAGTELGRNVLTIEMDEKYVETIKQRIAQQKLF